MLARTDASRGHERRGEGEGNGFLKVQFLSPIGEYPGGRETRLIAMGSSPICTYVSESSSMPEFRPRCSKNIAIDRCSMGNSSSFAPNGADDAMNEHVNLQVYDTRVNSRVRLLVRCSNLLALAKRTKLFRLKFGCRA